MVSLFRSLKQDELQKDLEEAYRVIGLLLEGIRLHAPYTTEALLQDFQTAIRAHEEQAEKSMQENPRTLLLTVGALLQTMQVYAKNSEAALKGARKEYQQMVAQLARVLVRVFGDNTQIVSGLGAVEQRLEAVSRIDDIRSIKVELDGCMKAVQAECRRQEQQAEQLRQAAVVAAEHPVVVQSFEQIGEDPITGLPSPGAASQMLREMVALSEDVYVAVLRLDSFKLIVSRFGQAVANQLLVEGSLLLAQALMPEDTLFRWYGPCMVAFLRNRKSLESARAEMDRLVARSRETRVSVEKKAVLFRVVVSALCLRTTQWASVEPLLEQMEAFANGEQRDRGRA